MKPRTYLPVVDKSEGFPRLLKEEGFVVDLGNFIEQSEKGERIVEMISGFLESGKDVPKGSGTISWVDELGEIFWVLQHQEDKGNTGANSGELRSLLEELGKRLVEIQVFDNFIHLMRDQTPNSEESQSLLWDGELVEELRRLVMEHWDLVMEKWDPPRRLLRHMATFYDSVEDEKGSANALLEFFQNKSKDDQTALKPLLEELCKKLEKFVDPRVDSVAAEESSTGTKHKFIVSFVRINAHRDSDDPETHPLPDPASGNGPSD